MAIFIFSAVLSPTRMLCLRRIYLTTASLNWIRPLREGVISDYDMTERMLKEFIRKVAGFMVFKPRVIILSRMSAYTLKYHYTQPVQFLQGIGGLYFLIFAEFSGASAPFFGRKILGLRAEPTLRKIRHNRAQSSLTDPSDRGPRRRGSPPRL